MYTQVWDHMNDQPHDAMIQRISDGAFIPFDDGNADYQEYKAWLAEGNKPNAAANPAPPIETTPPPDIHEVNAQVQDIDERLSDLENQMTQVQEATQSLSRTIQKS